ncbi:MULTISPECIES: flavodoxin domain-containing protein [unclassified Haloferax]|uniref:flavodoxin domain-containing protein n=1 Tax=unclassified Haloferax TaxID=2625095 RepID=UPI0002B14E25|nr:MULTISPECIES: flavodoxin domain-containing protein [unclassified Haloferax]ELZ54944.1 protoporphyrinogen oxidase [Haloferax sp. ATCC BAA-646]ELZ66331.1 protoporphyrinogen oxidase [Haloferax sp. ATCC BAA-644]ELZ66624.1 protoporphyrinogen oxidase [Haloferax sp. ATCC BAA-645]
MGTILVAYGSKEGQTEKIAGRIAVALAAHGHDVRTESVDDAAAAEALVDADAVLVGSSIHLGAHSKSVYGFVREHRDDIEARPNGFFQVSLSSALDDADARAEVATYIDEFIEESGWHPERMAAFGGALRYSEYGFLTRLVMKRIATDATGDTDTSRDYEYTDWDEVESFAADFSEYVESTAGTAAGGAAV